MADSGKAKELLDRIDEYLTKDDCSNIKSLSDFREYFGGPVKTDDGRKIDPNLVNFLQADEDYDELDDKRRKYYFQYSEQEFARAVCKIYLKKEKAKRMTWDEFYREMAALGLHKKLDTD